MQESERPDIRILKMECYIKDLENHIKTLEIKNDDFKIQIELLQQELSLKQNENLRLKNKIEEVEIYFIKYTFFGRLKKRLMSSY